MVRCGLGIVSLLQILRLVKIRDHSECSSVALRKEG